MAVPKKTDKTELQWNIPIEVKVVKQTNINFLKILNDVAKSTGVILKHTTMIESELENEFDIYSFSNSEDLLKFHQRLNTTINVLTNINLAIQEKLNESQRK